MFSLKSNRISVIPIGRRSTDQLIWSKWRTWTWLYTRILHNTANTTNKQTNKKNKWYIEQLDKTKNNYK